MDPIVLKQREFYKQHKTLDINFRINALKTLKKAILAYEDRINEAIKMDVGKSNFESNNLELTSLSPSTQATHSGSKYSSIISLITCDVYGLNSLGFNTTVFPAASASIKGSIESKKG